MTGHLTKWNGHTYVDTACFTAIQSAGIALDHIGFGDFRSQEPDLEFLRCNPVFGVRWVDEYSSLGTLPNFVGRTHLVRGTEAAIVVLLTKLALGGDVEFGEVK